MRLWYWLTHRSNEDRELDEEVAFHLSEETRLRINRGDAPDSAARSARRDFGNVTRVKESAREAWAWSAFDRVRQDLRFSVRMLGKSPAFTALALSALALGIGATASAYSIVNSVLLRPLPFPKPNRLVMVWETMPLSGKPNVVQTGNFLEWRTRNQSFENMAAFFPRAVNLVGLGDAVQIPGLYATAGFFEILGTPPLLGHVIRPEDDIPGTPGSVVLSYAFWQRRFGGKTTAIGRQVTVDGITCTVIGVMPRGFRLPAQPRIDVYLPMKIMPGAARLDGRNLFVVARLGSSTSLGAAAQDMRGIAAQTARERPEINKSWGARVVPLQEQTVGEARTTLLVVLSVAGIVLLIACANVANLLLMRAAARRRELNLRAALGAGRWRLLHQLLTEGLLLAAAGGLLGFALAFWGVPAILGMLPADFPLPRREEIAVDHAALWFTGLVSLGCWIFFGVLPALQVDAGRLSNSLQHGGRHGTAISRRLRNGLVIGEVGLAMLLVIGSGLMIRSLILLRQVAPGFQPSHLASFRMTLMASGPDLPQMFHRRALLVRQMLDEIRPLPGVRAAASIHMMPLSGQQSGTWYSRADRPAPPPAQGGGDVSVISDGYFQTMGIPLLAGREFNERDRFGSPPVTVINQTLARAVFPGENPIGKRMRVAWGIGTEPFEIVGVAADIHHNGLGTVPDPCLFLPQAQQPSGFLTLVARTDGDPHVITAIEEQIHKVNPAQGIAEVRPMESVVAADMAKPALEASVISIFGFLALGLASIGIYAVVSYSVEQRVREMGIRLALGAAPRSILSRILGEGLMLALVGIGAGLLAALALTRYLATLLYTVRPTDPLVYAAVTSILVAAALSGCYFPARRATRVDPALVLREE